MSMICVPIMVEEANTALLDASLAQAKGADLVEYRVDLLFEQREEEPLEERMSRVLDLVKESPLPCIVTCRPHWEGGEYHGDDDERISLYEALGTSDHPPAYIDVELATYTRSANIRQKVNLAVDHPKQQRSVTTKLILSTHDFHGRPSDLTRKILTMNDEPACSVVKIAYRARSIRDNLELFEILRDRQKPTIALGMGEFGEMSRILAPKFGGLLTFASLRSESTTAPGQPTIDDLLNLYRFRSISPTTKVYGIIGYPVTQSMSPLVHNAGFEKIGWDGVYVPMPVEGSYESFKATFSLIADDNALDFMGSSVTIPHKQHALHGFEDVGNWNPFEINAANTLKNYNYDTSNPELSLWQCANTDADAISRVIDEAIAELRDCKIAIYGSGGVAKAAAYVAAQRSADVSLFNRSHKRAEELASLLNAMDLSGSVHAGGDPNRSFDLYINCTPVGMTDGPDPDALSIPIPDMPPLPPETVFFDTVYNPIETPMLKAAKEHGYRTIDGVQMFVKQAEAQFQLWTGKNPPEGLFDQLVRAKLSEDPNPDQ
ncbi:MAG: type I 3-dehydroquinate dehydratase [Phycisphaerales bacterium]|nr:type I 3-dehydroquinate dehydratase [Phycisphaerales bacterium]